MRDGGGRRIVDEWGGEGGRNRVSNAEGEQANERRGETGYKSERRGQRGGGGGEGWESGADWDSKEG